MPTINEVWEQAQQINANLVIVHNDLTGLGASINGRLDNAINQLHLTNLRLVDLRDVVGLGLANISAGVVAIERRQDITNQLLALHAQQFQTIICILEKIARNTCAIHNEAHFQTHLQTAIEKNSAAEAHMFATVNPAAALEHRREGRLRAEIEKCCPPKPEAPPCVDKPCPEPKLPDIPRIDTTPVFTPPPAENIDGAEPDNPI